MRITIDIEDGLDVDLSIKKVARWLQEHERDPSTYPLKGVMTYADNTIIDKRDNRKTEVFRVRRKQDYKQ